MSKASKPVRQSGVFTRDNGDTGTAQIRSIRSRIGADRVEHTASCNQGWWGAWQIASLDLNVTLDFTHFTSLMEGYHNTVHGWVGGTMNNIQYSPADPVFWMHHAEVDRIWSLWQANPANTGGPTLKGAAATLDPWPESAGTPSHRSQRSATPTPRKPPPAIGGILGAPLATRSL